MALRHRITHNVIKTSDEFTVIGRDSLDLFIEHMLLNLHSTSWSCQIRQLVQIGLFRHKECKCHRQGSWKHLLRVINTHWMSNTGLLVYPEKRFAHLEDPNKSLYLQLLPERPRWGQEDTVGNKHIWWDGLEEVSTIELNTIPMRQKLSHFFCYTDIKSAPASDSILLPVAEVSFKNPLFSSTHSSILKSAFFAFFMP